MGIDVQAEVGTGAQATATPGAAGQAAQVTTNQVDEFVHLNCDLAFVSGHVANVPENAGIIIPQTGGAQVSTIPTPPAVEDVPGAASLNLGLTEENIPAGFQLYVVQGGDNLIRIARRFNTTTERLLELNPSITNPAILYCGQHLMVPGPQG